MQINRAVSSGSVDLVPPRSARPDRRGAVDDRRTSRSHCTPGGSGSDGGHRGLVSDPSRHERRDSRRVPVGARTRRQHRIPSRRDGIVAVAARVGHRRPGLHLCLRVLLLHRRRRRTLRRHPPGLLDSDGRVGVGRLGVDAVHLLGTHLDHVVPARRLQARRPGRTHGRTSSARDHRRRRALAARRIRPVRRRRRHRSSQ